MNEWNFEPGALSMNQYTAIAVGTLSVHKTFSHQDGMTVTVHINSIINVYTYMYINLSSSADDFKFLHEILRYCILSLIIGTTENLIDIGSK